MKKLVISGINLFQAGPLSIYYDCLDCIRELELYKKYEVIAFVHKKTLFNNYSDIITLIELPKSRDSYINRMYYEYYYFNKWSKSRNVSVWISLHDITPNVNSTKLYTYCHNPSPFMKKEIKNIKYSIKNVAFSFFYKYLYRINIEKANAIIVQQEWIRKEFMKMYPVKKVIVARPTISIEYCFNTVSTNKRNNKPVFIFSSYPRFYKNFDVICKACDLLLNDYNGQFEVWLTLDGSENNYSKELKSKYGSNKNIKWLGLQARESVFKLYEKADYLIFPSVLETWGLPISEFKCTGKGIILADLPYAHETLGNYAKAAFFNPYNEYELYRYIKHIINGNNVFKPVTMKEPERPYARNWIELFELICK